MKRRLERQPRRWLGVRRDRKTLEKEDPATSRGWVGASGADGRGRRRVRTEFTRVDYVRKGSAVETEPLAVKPTFKGLCGVGGYSLFGPEGLRTTSDSHD